MLNTIVGHTLSCKLKEAGMPLEPCAPSVYHIEVFEGVYRKEYRQPYIWEALDWLQSKNICVYSYPMTQWRKLAIRKFDKGTLIKDIAIGNTLDHEQALIYGIQEALNYLQK